MLETALKSSNPDAALTEMRVIAETRHWVEQIVLRHNFCPFAHQPFKKETIYYAVSLSNKSDEIAQVLVNELLRLNDGSPGAIETTLLMTPNCFNDFGDYNDYLSVVDLLIEQLGLEGMIQVASFHPEYQFEGLDIDDVRNYTNRSLYPMFHLILEDSIEHARATHPDVDSIPQTNMALLENLGVEKAKSQLNSCREEE